MRVLFTTAPMRGHFFPLVPLAWAMRAAGHEVLVAAPETFLPTVLRSGLPAVASGPHLDFVDLVGGAAAADAGERRARHGLAFARIAGACLPGMRSVVESWRPDLVVSERAELAGPLAASAYGVPYVEYQWGVAPLAEYRAVARTELDLRHLAPPVEVLNPWPPRLRLPHATHHQTVRDMAYNGDAPVPLWALSPRARPRVCVTFGTVVPRLGGAGMRDVMEPMLSRLAELDVELLVAADDDIVKAWPALRDSADHVGRFSLAQVLPACDLLVSHGGQGTVLTALAAGCPQLVMPQFDDQFDNAEAVVTAGAGLRVTGDEVTPGLVAELLKEPRFAEAAAAIAAEIAELPAPAAIMSIMEKLAA